MLPDIIKKSSQFCHGAIYQGRFIISKGIRVFHFHGVIGIDDDVVASREGEHEYIQSQGEEEHRERREITFSFAVDDVEHHLSGTAKQFLQGKKHAAVVT